MTAKGYRVVCVRDGIGAYRAEFRTLKEALKEAENILNLCGPDGSTLKGYPHHIETLGGKVVLDMPQLAERLGRQLIKVVPKPYYIWEV